MRVAITAGRENQGGGFQLDLEGSNRAPNAERGPTTFFEADLFFSLAPVAVLRSSLSVGAFPDFAALGASITFPHDKASFPRVVWLMALPASLVSIRLCSLSSDASGAGL